MPGFLLIAPTGSGKSWAIKNDPFFKEFAIDGDPLITTWDWSTKDWTIPDRNHLNIVFERMRTFGKCVCWYVGTTAIADAINEGRLSRDEVGIVLLPEHQHRIQVEKRKKNGHDWSRALEHRNLCDSLLQNYGILRFNSFPEAAEYLIPVFASPPNADSLPG